MRVVALVIVLLCMMLSGSASAGAPLDFAAYVDPFIGTAPAPHTGFGQEFDGGDVFPGAAYPAGMLSWSPDTAEHSLPGGYFYPDRTIKGFSLTHFSGRGCTVYQDVPISAMTESLAASPVVSPAVVWSTFSHENESAWPGYYAVTLDNGVRVQLTVSPRTGFGQFTFPPQQNTGTLVIDAGGSVNGVFDSSVSIDPDQRLVTGRLVSQVGCGNDRYNLYFAIAFDRPFSAYGTWSEDQLSPGAVSTQAAHTGAYVAFDIKDGQQVQVKPAISYVSVENALTNLAAENPDWNFSATRARARSAWNDALGRIEVSGGSDRDLTVFYTALYHTFFHPNVFSDANGEYVGFDDQVHQVPAGHAHYHNIPGWDQYRSLVQLRAMLAPDQMSDILQSLVDDALSGGGGMPRWEQANRNSAGMVGDSPGAYVANGYAFGARDFDTASALQALDFGASDPNATSGGHSVREYLQPWLARGYVPDQPSITLEYAIDDFAIAQFAAALGDTSKSTAYSLRAAQWLNTFNAATGYIESRDASGSFAQQEHGRSCCGFVEGNAAQYTWMVPFDFPGLITQVGGPASAITRLDDFFVELNAGANRPHAWIGNEPGFSAPWAYDFAGAPARTQAVVRRIQRELFDATPSGLPGNDDGGTTSAWYVFSALGLFPTVPGVAGVSVGSPLFAGAVVHLGGGRTLDILAHGAAADSPYVREVLLDGDVVDAPWLDWSRLAAGATLEFSLGSTPTDWGTSGVLADSR